MSWWWRNEPRSILRTIEWFEEFAKLEGENWDEVDAFNKSIIKDNTIHPVRRKYIYNAHAEETPQIASLSLNQFLSGKFDRTEVESSGRNNLTTFSFFGFGYASKDGTIRITDVGRRIAEGIFDSDDFLKQLVKLEFPNSYSAGKEFKQNEHVFPLQLVCLVIDEVKTLNKYELGLLFACNDIKYKNKVVSAINSFRSGFSAIKKKQNKSEIYQVFERVFVETYGKMQRRITTYVDDYGDALLRCLLYTNLFKASGRGLLTSISVPEYNKSKFQLLLNGNIFEHRVFLSLDDYMKWFGNCDSIQLPWENENFRKTSISEKINFISSNLSINDGQKSKAQEIIELAKGVISSNKTSVTKLKDVENELVDFITSSREEEFINVKAQTNEARQEILDMYDQILNKVDMGALWLEVNTWKSLLAIRGNKIVKRNFKIEEDLTPKSFAPGIGNTPDMELYLDDCIIIPEVSLMTGVRQWEHEASSVIDHVLSFIKDNSGIKVRGLFLSSSLNIRTKWQFFVLNKESWVEDPVPVIPLTIEQYKEILSIIYKYNLQINELANLLENIYSLSVESANFNDWFKATSSLISDWKKYPYSLV